jgi:hypothetical protein
MLSDTERQLYESTRSDPGSYTTSNVFSLYGHAIIGHRMLNVAIGSNIRGCRA